MLKMRQTFIINPAALLKGGKKYKTIPGYFPYPQPVPVPIFLPFLVLRNKTKCTFNFNFKIATGADTAKRKK
jgi:hypothetical protein